MALRGLAYNVRMAAYNSDGGRVSGLAATITATLWADGTAATLSGITITEIGSTGVYIVPLTAEQMTAYNLCMTATSSTAGITFDPVYLDTDNGRMDTNVGSRLATSGYTAPPTVNDIQSGLATYANLADKTALIPVLSANVNGLTSMVSNGIMPRLPASGTLATVTDVTDITPTAVSIASAVWSADTRTITATPTYNGPTAAEMAAACIESIASTFIVPAIYGVKLERTSSYPDRRQQQEAFAARIQRMYDDSPLNPAFVDSITYTAYKLESNVAGVPSTIVTGHENVNVPVSALSDHIAQSAHWSLDLIGCNFVHVPDQSQNYLFPTAGVYEVVYTITLATGSPITLVYNAVITE